MNTQGKKDTAASTAIRHTFQQHWKSLKRIFNKDNVINKSQTTLKNMQCCITKFFMQFTSFFGAFSYFLADMPGTYHVQISLLYHSCDTSRSGEQKCHDLLCWVISGMSTLCHYFPNEWVQTGTENPNRYHRRLQQGKKRNPYSIQ